MASPNLDSPSLAALQHISHLLHLFHHRNKNQHRHSVWWRHFSVFRKNLNRMVADYQRLATIPTTHLARIRKKTLDARTQARIAARVEVWGDVMVGKWQRAFSQVVADGRFAVLGVVLVAALGEVCRVVGVTAALEELGQVEMERVLERFAAEGWEDGGDVEGGGREDVGEVVSRAEPEGNEGDMEESMLDRPETTLSKSGVKDRKQTPASRIVQADSKSLKRLSNTTSLAKKKKRKKGGDAIDDLFSGL